VTERFEDAEQCAARAAEIVAAEIARGSRQLVLAGGTTPMRAYTLLDTQPGIDWAGVHLWYGDERCVPFDDPESNHGQVAAVLRAPGAYWHPMPGPQGPQHGAELYAEELADTKLDVVLLGMGPDGHTASLFPDHPVLDAPGRVTGVDDSPKPPPQRITLTLTAINTATRIVLMVSGAEKAAALAEVLGEPTRSRPASLLARDRLTILADAAAMSMT
jgi:6-phosphogluconolactonase